MLNKIDQISETSLKELVAIMESLNPLAKVGTLASMLLLAHNPTPSANLVPLRPRSPALHDPISAQKQINVQIHLLSENVLPRARKRCKSMAVQVVPCQQGRVDINSMFGPGSRGVIASLNIEGQHRSAVSAAAKAHIESHKERHAHGDDKAHAHAHGHEENGGAHDHAHQVRQWSELVRAVCCSSIAAQALRGMQAMTWLHVMICDEPPSEGSCAWRSFRQPRLSG